MTISFRCECGKHISVKDEFAGRKGKCPACNRTLVVPAPPGVEEPPLELAPEHPSPLPAPRACPGCGARYEPEVLVCVKCGINLKTGRPIEAGSGPPPAPRRVRARRETQEEKKPFHQLLLGVLIHPVSTMETLAYYLGFPDTLVKMSAFFVLSLIAVYVGALYLPAVKAAEDGSGDFLWEADADEPKKHMIRGGGYSGTLRRTPGRVRAGGEMLFELSLADKETGEPFGGQIEVGLGPPGGYRPEWTFLSAASTGEPGQFEVSHVFEQPGYYDSRIVLHPEGESREVFIKPGPIEVPAREPVRGPAPGAAAVGVGTIAVCAAVVSLLIEAAILNFGGRLVGGAGNLVGMFAVLAFLAGVVNCFQIALVVLGPLAGAWIKWGFVGWRVWLYFLAVMKVYDVDFAATLLIIVVAFTVQAFIGMTITLWMISRFV